MDLKDRIKTRAKELGFCKIGFTTMEDLPRVSEEAMRRDYPDFLQSIAEHGAHPKQIAPDARSIIILAYDFSEIAFPKNMLPHVGRVYLSHSFIPQEGSPARERLTAFEAYLTEEGVDFEPDRIELMIRPAALRAGVASFGRNNFSYVDGIGSFVTLYGYYTSHEFEPDEPAPNCSCPPGCHACIDACPMNVMKEPFNLDASKCMVWVNALAYSKEDLRFIPEDLREGLGQHIHGCDVCQTVCPQNQKALRRDKKPDALLERIASEFTLEKVLHMPDGFYEACILPIMYNYVRTPAVFQRNAAIAMGNSGNTSYIDDLKMELDSPDEMIRTHAQWALDKLESSKEQQ